MDICSRVQLSGRLYELIHEIIITLASDSGFSKAEIQIVVEKFFVVGAAIENYGESSVGVDSSTESCEDEFSN